MSKDNYSKVMFYELSKNQNDDSAEFARYGDIQIGRSDYLSTVRQQVQKDEMPYGTHVNTHRRSTDDHPFPSWSIALEPGRNVYAIRLANERDGSRDGRAYFGADPAPVIGLSEHIPPFKSYISDVRLHPPEKAAYPNWASFVVDVDVLLHSDEVKKMTLEKQSHFVQLPIYLNLFDRDTDLPVWMVADHAHVSKSRDHRHKHDDEKPPIVTHGGFHPPTVTNSLIVELP